MTDTPITAPQTTDVTVLEVKLRHYELKLDSINAKLGPIETALPDHLKVFIAKHHQNIDITRLSEIARERYKRYLEAIKIRSDVRTKIAALRKLIPLLKEQAKQKQGTSCDTGVSDSKKEHQSEPSTATESGSDADASDNGESDEATITQPAKKGRRKGHKIDELTLFQECLNDNTDVGAFVGVPVHIIGEIMTHLSSKDIGVLALANKAMYSIVGNQYKWNADLKLLSIAIEQLEFEETNTPRRALALSKLGPKKCQSCGANANLKDNEWKAKLCLSCRGITYISLKTAKSVFRLSKKQLQRVRQGKIGRGNYIRKRDLFTMLRRDIGMDKLRRMYDELAQKKTK